MTFRILLPAEFQDIHRQAALEWVARGHRFSQREWRTALRAFDLLREAAVITPQGIMPFSALYFQHIEESYADGFIRSLLAAEDVTRAGIEGWAEVAGRIPTILHDAGLLPAQQPTARLLVAYCLYWWYAFAYGYMFEVEVLRDLEQSGVEFSAHSLADRAERLSRHDLEVLGFRGDIKRSLAFLQTVRGQRLPLSFYIVRLTLASQRRTLVVMMRQPMWDKIDGDTILTTLEGLTEALSAAAQIRVGNTEAIVADYELWKRLVRRRQARS
jgi:hypothetical protein